MNGKKQEHVRKWKKYPIKWKRALNERAFHTRKTNYDTYSDSSCWDSPSCPLSDKNYTGRNFFAGAALLFAFFAPVSCFSTWVLLATFRRRGFGLFRSVASLWFLLWCIVDLRQHVDCLTICSVPGINCFTYLIIIIISIIYMDWLSVWSVKAGWIECLVGKIIENE